MDRLDFESFLKSQFIQPCVDVAESLSNASMVEIADVLCTAWEFQYTEDVIGFLKGIEPSNPMLSCALTSQMVLIMLDRELDVPKFIELLERGAYAL